MKLKLIRKDIHDLNYFYLNEGNHIIGRNGVLKCDDKRIARCHASIEVFDNGKVTLKALHHNPCFYYLSNDLSKMMILNQNNECIINNGDEISLLPDSYRFAVSIEDGSTILSSNSNGEESSTAINASIESNVAMSVESLNDSKDDDVIPIVPHVPLVDLCSSSNIEIEPNDNSPAECISSESQSKRKCESDGNKEEECEENPSGESSNKRQRTESTGEIKPNISDMQSTENEGNNIAGSSSTVKEESNVDVKVKKEKVDDVVRPLRDKCDYGSSCYRRNPQHRKDMSHPGDPDWDAPRLCPYGAACYRTNSQHRNSYTHPGPPAPRPSDPQNEIRTKKNKRKVTNKKKRYSYSDTDDDCTENEDVWEAADSSDAYEPVDEGSSDCMDDEDYSYVSYDEGTPQPQKKKTSQRNAKKPGSRKTARRSHR